MRVGIDVSPFVVEPRRGVARALAALLMGLHETPDRPDVWFFGADNPLCVEDIRPGLLGLGTSRFAELWSKLVSTGTRRTHRRRCRSLARERGIDVWYSPWSAFPDVGCPVVVTVHELPFVRQGPIEGRVRAWRHRRWLARDVERAARIVVPSSATRDDLLALRPDAEGKVRVVPHGFVPLPATAMPPSERPSPPRGLVVGGRNARKGMDVWLEARRALGNALDWVLVGAPPPGVSRALKSDFVVGRDSRVRVVDDASDAELAAELRQASLLVYPSLSEGFGFPPLEAMALDVPVVSTTAGSIPEVCGDAALLVPPGDPVALADAVRRVLTDADLRARLVRAGRVRAKAFPPRATAKRLLDVFEEAVAEPRR